MPNAIEQFYGHWVMIEATLVRGSVQHARKTAVHTRALNENEIRVDFNFSALGSSKLVQVSAWLKRPEEKQALSMINGLPPSGRRIILHGVFTPDDSLLIIQKNNPCDVFALRKVLYVVSREITAKT